MFEFKLNDMELTGKRVEYNHYHHKGKGVFLKFNTYQDETLVLIQCEITGNLIEMPINYMKFNPPLKAEI